MIGDKKMKVMLNDLSFQYTMPSKADAFRALECFVDLCKQLNQGIQDHVYTNVEEKIITAPDGNYDGELAPHVPFRKLVGEMENREKKRYLLQLLKNSATPPLDATAFYLDGKASYLCASACKEEGAVLSLRSAQLFEGPELYGMYCEKECVLKNISKQEHMDFYKELLGKRVYHANTGKHKPQRLNNYGKDKPASPMDLNDQQAQELLDRAIWVDGRLYGRRDGKNYAFQQESPCVFHGYVDDSLPDHVVRALDGCKDRWKM